MPCSNLISWIWLGITNSKQALQINILIIDLATRTEQVERIDIS